jgi:hypothetical protein
MTTALHKPIRRRSNEFRRDRGKARAIIVTLYPAGYIGLRLQGLRCEEPIPIESVYERAVKMRLLVSEPIPGSRELHCRH